MNDSRYYNLHVSFLIFFLVNIILVIYSCIPGFIRDKFSPDSDEVEERLTPEVDEWQCTLFTDSLFALKQYYTEHYIGIGISSSDKRKEAIIFAKTMAAADMVKNIRIHINYCLRIWKKQIKTKDDIIVLETTSKKVIITTNENIRNVNYYYLDNFTDDSGNQWYAVCAILSINSYFNDYMRLSDETLGGYEEALFLFQNAWYEINNKQ